MQIKQKFNKYMLNDVYKLKYTCLFAEHKSKKIGR